jgi:hypothetical protein
LLILVNIPINSNNPRPNQLMKSLKIPKEIARSRELKDIQHSGTKNGQLMICKILHRKVKIEQHGPH